jgi:hypothetical protein
MTNERGTLWVRYLGSKVVHRADVFPIPTDTVPARVSALKNRGDIAQIWYVPGLEWVRDANEEWNAEKKVKS